MNKGKYKIGDIITDYGHDNEYWSIWKVLHKYDDEDLGIHYWIKCIYYENSDGACQSAMDIHSEEYMDIMHFRKLKDDDEPELLAKII